MTRDERILNQIKVLNPVDVVLKNNSAQHANHIEHIGGVAHTGETHYKLKIVSEVFNGLSRIDRQRKVYDLLSEEFKTGLHALELKTYTPEEYQRKQN